MQITVQLLPVIAWSFLVNLALRGSRHPHKTVINNDHNEGRPVTLPRILLGALWKHGPIARKRCGLRASHDRYPVYE